jgi:glycine/serine hydroxymethyltransferase
MGVDEMRRVAELIADVLANRDDAAIERARAGVAELAEAFPLYPNLVGVGG